MKKAIIIIAICLMSLMLCGCMAGIAEVTVNTDGTIDIFSQTGISESTINAMSSTSEEVNNIKNQTKFVYNGVAYYGEVENQKGINVDEFNKIINEGNEFGTDQGVYKLSKNTDGTYLLTLTINENTADTAEMEANMEINGLNRSTIDRLMKDMVMSYTFYMPGPVTQITGSTKGITINNNKLVINYLKLDIPIEENEKATYGFKIENELKFLDVPQTLWSYDAINTLADGGLVSGVGNKKFSPERGMKIAEFCQVLVNARGLESGSDENGYWAAKAIKSCIDKGYIYSHGEINPQNYDVIITREEAIAAMQIASGRQALNTENAITLSDIPDGEDIDEKYRETVLQAYNSGITTGVNAELKFSPKNQLTRGQVCQLFYNVDWTTKIQ